MPWQYGKKLMLTEAAVGQIEVEIKWFESLARAIKWFESSTMAVPFIADKVKVCTHSLQFQVENWLCHVTTVLIHIYEISDQWIMAD